MSTIQNILLDRDGTIIFDKHYLSDPEGVELIPGAGEALQSLARAGMRFFVLTNQSGIGRGYFSEKDFAACTERLDALLAEYDVRIEATVHCPHSPDVECDCRKPLTGMWNTLVGQYGLVPEQSVMIGDKKADVGLGLNADLAASILVLTGKGEAHAEKLEVPASLRGDYYDVAKRSDDQPHCVARDLGAAAKWILAKTE